MRKKEKTVERNQSKTRKDAAAVADLGRYKKKVADQNKEIKAMRERLQALDAVVKGLNMAMMADLAALAIKYGEYDNDANGYRLTLPVKDIRDALDKWEVRTRKDDEAAMYIIGVLPKETANGD